MSNKFLGLNSINVLKEYIDDQITSINNTSKLVTIQAYSYHKHGEIVNAPMGGGFDSEGVTMVYPENWYSLNALLSTENEKPLNPQLSEFNSVEEALSDGSVWMSAGVINGTNSAVWSTPMKVSGQNGVSVRFKYTYDNSAELTNDEILSLSDHPQGVDAENRAEYVWSQSGEDPWVGPALWAVYSQDASMVYWRYCVTGENEDGTPIIPNNPGVGPWVKEIPRQDISEDYPYMWMSYQIAPAGQTASDNNWSEPILFGHYGRNGDVPDYTQNLYCKGLDDVNFPEMPGIIAPEKPEFVEDKLIEDYITEQWLELPTDDKGIWWMCTFKIKGRNNKVMEIGSVKRYNGVDGSTKPGPFTKYLYAWSADQNSPEFNSEDLLNNWQPNNWYETPDYDKAEDWSGEILSDMPEASLWLVAGLANGVTEEGYPNIYYWSEPLKLSGPRGPIAYDYRIETRYNIGTSEKPRALPTEEIWTKEAPRITNTYPYIWAVNYLVCYKMKYDTANPNEDGSYPVVEADNGSIVDRNNNGYFRVSGLNGEDGNRKNNIDYKTTQTTINVESFASTNYYISNSTEDVTYNINLDTLSFINGYTGKFSNIGTGNMIINAGSKFKFVGSCTESTEITLNPQETIELICYNNDDNKELIVIGKELA